ncbi:MAG: hypothetical protein RIS47_1378, partial [Bacteroidota bacterium]
RGFFDVFSSRSKSLFLFFLGSYIGLVVARCCIKKAPTLWVGALYRVNCVYSTTHVLPLKSKSVMQEILDFAEISCIWFSIFSS